MAINSRHPPMRPELTSRKPLDAGGNLCDFPSVDSWDEESREDDSSQPVERGLALAELDFVSTGRFACDRLNVIEIKQLLRHGGSSISSMAFLFRAGDGGLLRRA